MVNVRGIAWNPEKEEEISLSKVLEFLCMKQKNHHDEI